MKHEVRTFNASGKCVWEESYRTAEAAYKGYCEIVDNLKRNLPKGYTTTVVRYNDGVEMTVEEVKGTAK